MIVYFADRQLNIIGQASTELPGGLVVTADRKTEDIETGVAIFECQIPFDKATRAMVEQYTEVGNYVLRAHGGDNELYTIIDAEIDTKKQQVYIYAEDDGMDLLNEVVGVYEADQAYNIAHYINKYAAGAGFEIGINEAKNLTRKLSWDGESTASARIASVATQFDGCEISYSFEVDGLYVVRKYINIYKKRGKDVGIQLRLNQDIDRIITTKSIANLATALQCVGATPDDEDFEDDIEPVPVTLDGYSYDDGDFYVDGILLKSREALKRWSRFLWKTEESQRAGGHIVKQFSYDTLEQSTLCAHAITELKKIRDMEVNYEIDIRKLPDNVKIGDRVNVIDDAGELYVSARVLMLETSVADQESKAIIGEYLIKHSGIAEKVAELAAQFAKNSASAARALEIAKESQEVANGALTEAENAGASADAAQESANEALEAAGTATESANAATEAANQAQAAVDVVENQVSSLETTITNAQQAADNAHQAATTAGQKADEAKEAAENAAADAQEALEAAGTATENASAAVESAAAAVETAESAVEQAAQASQTATNAKADAEQAERDIAALGETLETVQTTMQTDYTRKSEFTETTASLQSQISQNSAQISSTVSLVSTIDETANNAAEQATQAQNTAAAAQTQADQATADAQAAQTAADQAAAAAANAQSEADTAKAAAATAKSVADKAETDLAAAKADLETVQGRVDATEEEITAAQQAVEAAQAAADQAKEDADAAAEKATQAQTAANAAVSNAEAAQTTANDAATQAALAQQVANEAKGDAAAAQAAADEAAATAAEAKRTADTAKTNAETAQTKANEAAAAAATAQQAADDADAKAVQAAADLVTAEQNLANVTSRVDATEEEVAAAQAAVTTAQQAANTAKAEAEAAQETADTAKANAATAQQAANTAKTAADNAQVAADEAQAAADKAQADVDALAVRVTTAETSITQNAQQIALRATKTEVAETLGGYYTKEEADAAVELSADAVKTTVSNTYATKQEVNSIEVGGRNLFRDSKLPLFSGSDNGNKNKVSIVDDYVLLTPSSNGNVYNAEIYYTETLQKGETYTFSLEILTPDRIGFYWCPSERYVKTNYINGSTAWQKIVFTYTQTGDDTTTSYNLVGLNGLIAEHEYRYRHLKLEKGNKATDWAPAPEDTDQAIKDISVGGRNLVANSDTEISGGRSQTHTYDFTEHGSALVRGGGKFAISFDAKTDIVEGTCALRIRAYTGANGSFLANVNVEFSPTTTYTRYFAVIPNVGSTTHTDAHVFFVKNVTNATLSTKNVKIERGDKTTDWTPAPEDVAQDISDAENRLNDTITEKEATILATAEGITLEALESYTTASEFGEFKQSTESQFALHSDELNLKFTGVNETVAEIDGELQAVKEEWAKNFRADENGLEISGGSETTLRLDNETGIEFVRNGRVTSRMDGDNFFTGNIVIRANERAQFGMLGFVTRPDGSLMFKKIGTEIAIITHPQAQTVVQNTSVTMSVEASGTMLSYQWQRALDNTNYWGDIAGATSSTYTFTAERITGTLSGGMTYNRPQYYRCAVIDAIGTTVYSDAALLTVNLT